MATDPLSLGRAGEDAAARLLSGAGLQILDRNWRCTIGAVRGELDLVARQGDTLVVCEVKTRRGRGYGTALEAVTQRKVMQVRRLAAAYVASTPWHPRHIRIDVIAVTWRRGRLELEHLVGVG